MRHTAQSVQGQLFTPRTPRIHTCTCTLTHMHCQREVHNKTGRTMRHACVSGGGRGLEEPPTLHHSLGVCGWLHVCAGPQRHTIASCVTRHVIASPPPPHPPRPMTPQRHAYLHACNALHACMPLHPNRYSVPCVPARSHTKQTSGSRRTGALTMLRLASSPFPGPGSSASCS